MRSSQSFDDLIISCKVNLRFMQSIIALLAASQQANLQASKKNDAAKRLFNMNIYASF